MKPSPAARRALQAVALKGSYAAAARGVGVSQPAITQQIRELERASGAILFARCDGRLIPTPFCSELVGLFEEIEHLEARAEQVLARRRATSSGLLRIGLGNAMPGMALIGAFQRGYPGVQIEVISHDYAGIIDAVVERRVDIGILPNLPPDQRFERETLIEQDVVAIAHPGDPIARFDNVDCQQLARVPLLFRSSGSSTQRLVDSAFRKAGLSPRPRLVLDTRDAVYEAVVNRMGVGFMWRHGTGRTDAIRRIGVIGIAPPCAESVFRLQGPADILVTAFFAAARSFHRDSRVGAIAGRG